MSAVKTTENFINVADYLTGELVAERKHEYIDGNVYAMAGASLNHERICSNLLRKLGNHLEDSRCEVVGSDLKVNVRTKFFYPDVMVICNDEKGDEYSTDSPIIIVEVLSKSTRQKDKLTKRHAYQSLSSLKEYVLIEQNCVEIEISRRSQNWFPEYYFLGDEVYFEALDFKLAVEEIYRRVDNEDMQDFLKKDSIP